MSTVQRPPHTQAQQAFSNRSKVNVHWHAEQVDSFKLGQTQLDAMCVRVAQRGAVDAAAPSNKRERGSDAEERDGAGPSARQFEGGALDSLVLAGGMASGGGNGARQRLREGERQKGGLGELSHGEEEGERQKGGLGEVDQGEEEGGGAEIEEGAWKKRKREQGGSSSMPRAKPRKTAKRSNVNQELVEDRYEKWVLRFFQGTCVGGPSLASLNAKDGSRLAL